MIKALNNHYPSHIHSIHLYYYQNAIKYAISQYSSPSNAPILWAFDWWWEGGSMDALAYLIYHPKHKKRNLKRPRW